MDGATGDVLVENAIDKLLTLDGVQSGKDIAGRGNQVFSITAFHLDLTIRQPGLQ